MDYQEEKSLGASVGGTATPRMPGSVTSDIYQDTMHSDTLNVVRASKLTGQAVLNAAGEDLGTLTDIVVDVKAGKITYGILSFGGFLGMGTKLFAVPWSKVKIEGDQQVYVLDTTREQMENAPAFDDDNWPNFGDRTYGSQVHTHYGAEPYWSEPSRGL